MSHAVHLCFDDSWPESAIEIPSCDMHDWGPKLRYCASRVVMDDFYAAAKHLFGEFTLYGSGDFHHVTSLLLRRIKTPFVLVSFDNHPDWDIRNPKWACGSWINRALDLGTVTRASIWGCGSFECWPPHERYGNLGEVSKGRLDVHPWAQERPASERNRQGAIEPHNWRHLFDAFCRSLRQSSVYVTIDMDCLAHCHAVTNWENGYFTPDDISWALSRLRSEAVIIGGDVCGAYSQPEYSSWRQQIISENDHPQSQPPNLIQAYEVNIRSLEIIWKSLTESVLRITKAAAE